MQNISTLVAAAVKKTLRKVVYSNTDFMLYIMNNLWLSQSHILYT